MSKLNRKRACLALMEKALTEETLILSLTSEADCKNLRYDFYHIRAIARMHGDRRFDRLRVRVKENELTVEHT